MALVYLHAHSPRLWALVFFLLQISFPHVGGTGFRDSFPRGGHISVRSRLRYINKALTALLASAVPDCYVQCSVHACFKAQMKFAVEFNGNRTRLLSLLTHRVTAALKPPAYEQPGSAPS